MAFWFLNKREEAWLRIGMVIGAVVWLRPDGLTLLGPAVFILVLKGRDSKSVFLEINKADSGFLDIYYPLYDF